MSNVENDTGIINRNVLKVTSLGYGKKV